MNDGKWRYLGGDINTGKQTTVRGPLIHHNGADFSILWTGAKVNKENSFFDLQKVLMQSEKTEDLHAYLPDFYTSMPVNLVAGF